MPLSAEQILRSLRPSDFPVRQAAWGSSNLIHRITS